TVSIVRSTPGMRPNSSAHRRYRALANMEFTINVRIMLLRWLRVTALSSHLSRYRRGEHSGMVVVGGLRFERSQQFRSLAQADSANEIDEPVVGFRPDANIPNISLRNDIEQTCSQTKEQPYYSITRLTHSRMGRRRLCRIEYLERWQIPLLGNSFLFEF